jgi:hypothetical protein
MLCLLEGVAFLVRYRLYYLLLCENYATPKTVGIVLYYLGNSSIGPKEPYFLARTKAI